MPFDNANDNNYQLSYLTLRRFGKSEKGVKMNGLRMKALRGAALMAVTVGACPALAIAQSSPGAPADTTTDADDDRLIIVTGVTQEATAGTKTDTPLIQTPQPISIISSDVYTAQGAISISDTLRYVAGIQANPYGPDSRVDGGNVRSLDPLQFRDGMRDIFSYYASIRADPYNFSRVEVVRGPASVLFGQGSLGGIVNLVSKVPEFEKAGEMSVVYGMYDRKEAMADYTGPIGETLAARIVARVRDAGTQVDHVPDDRVLVSPSLRWRPSDNTDLTLLGLYQEDDGGSTSQFLPVVGTLYPNPNIALGELPHDSFIGVKGWDRYSGRLLQGTGMLEQRFGETIKLSLKARYIDSDLDYFTHYPDSYSNPIDPYLDPAKRLIGRYTDQSVATMNVFSTDNNVQAKFNTGAAVEHTLLAGVDYSWNRVVKTGAFGFSVIDLYNPEDPDRTTLPELTPTGTTRESQSQIGFYVQDQIRFWDRVSIVLGARHDNLTTRAEDVSGGKTKTKDKATTFRAGIIGELAWGLSPFFSYTESFLPITGETADGSPFKPQTGRQFEAGVKWAPDGNTMVTATAYHIKDRNRPITDPNPPAGGGLPGQIQAGVLTSKGYELEAKRTLPENFDLIVNYSYTKSADEDGNQLANVSKHNASAWMTKTFQADERTSLRLGAGVRYTGANRSSGTSSYVTFDPWTIVTPSVTIVDALVSVSRDNWTLSINANNLLGQEYYSACLARGDCFNGADRNVFGTLRYSF
jgi:iron complex outermembrane receptor protein